jgi:hypothetical protein
VPKTQLCIKYIKVSSIRGSCISGVLGMVYIYIYIYTILGRFYPRRKRSVGKPRKSWLDDAENDLKKMGFIGSKKIAKDRDACKLIL